MSQAPATVRRRVDEIPPVLVHPTTAVNAFLADLLDQRRHELTSVDRVLAPLVDVVGEYIMRGGKRLRPAFVYWGHRAADGVDAATAIQAGAALELLHTFALLHDDVMDRSDTRRSLPSAHRQFERHHRSQARPGDSEWFGMSAAVLAGDLVSAWADELIAGLPVDRRTLGRAQKVYSELRREAIAGQFLDLWQPTDDEQALHIALLKTARYTVTHPLLLGLTVTGYAVPDETTRALTTFGDAIGLAFQLRDDIIGLFGQSAESGKSNLDDMRQGKRTLLITSTERLATADQLAVLHGALGNPSVAPTTVEQVQHIVSTCGALEYVEEAIQAHRDIALDALDHAASINPLAAHALNELAVLATARRR